MDPRLEIIDQRLKRIKRIIAVSGGKGGIGKSLVATTLALILRRSNKIVGLLDLDFSGPSTNLILGIKGVHALEARGIVPPEFIGLRYMSVIYFAQDNPAPLRGADISNAIIELLAVTRWGELDFLIVDMPPGIGDATLDTIRLMKRAEFLILTTPSKVALGTVKKMITMLKGLSFPIIGLIENMRRPKSPSIREEIDGFDVPFLGTIDFDEEIEGSIGNTTRLLETAFAWRLREILLETPTFDLEEPIL